MKFDIAFAFSSFVTPGMVMRGFVSAEPFEGTAEEAEKVRTKLQTSMLNLDYISLFTRDNTPMHPYIDAEAGPAEMTIGQDMIKQCVLTTQIIQYKERE